MNNKEFLETAAWVMSKALSTLVKLLKSHFRKLTTSAQPSFIEKKKPLQHLLWSDP